MGTRKEKGLRERMHLLYSPFYWEEKDSVNYNIVGSSGKTYEVFFSREEVYCTCLDHLIRKKICKHMYFILGIYLKSYSYIDNIFTIEDIRSNALLIVNSTHEKEASKKIKQNKESYHNKKNNIHDICCICHENLTDVCPLSHLSCHACKKIMHKICIESWLKKKKNCPMCRSTWKKGKCMNYLKSDIKYREIR